MAASLCLSLYFAPDAIRGGFSFPAGPDGSRSAAPAAAHRPLAPPQQVLCTYRDEPRCLPVLLLSCVEPSPALPRSAVPPMCALAHHRPIALPWRPPAIARNQDSGVAVSSDCSRRSAGKRRLAGKKVAGALAIVVLAPDKSGDEEQS